MRGACVHFGPVQADRASDPLPAREDSPPVAGATDDAEDAAGEGERPWWRPSRAIVLVVASAFALRLAWVAMAGHEPTVLSDASLYMRYAREIAAGDGYIAPGVFLSPGHLPTAYHPIGYPGLLGGLFWIGNALGAHDEAFLANLLNVVLGTATVGLVYAIASRLFDRTVALVAAGMVAVWPNLIFYSSSVMSETAFAFTVVLAVWIAIDVPWPEGLTVRRGAAYGLVLGASVLIRPFSALLLLLAVVAPLVGGIPWARVWRFAVVAMLGVVVVVLPWTIRNAIQMHGFVPVATNVGDLLCIDNSPGATGALRHAEQCPEPAAFRYSAKAEIDANQRNTVYSLRWAISHPVVEAWLLPQRFYYGYQGDHDGLDEALRQRPNERSLIREHAAQVSLIADVYFFVALAFAGFGLGWFLSRSRPRRLFVALAALALAATPLYTYGLPRFHVPASPLLAILAAPAVTALARAVKTARSEGSASAAA